MKNIAFISLFLFCTHALYATGFSDWNHKTENGSTIADAGGGTVLYTNTDQVLSNLLRWYFYKDHIIGEYDTFINPEYKTAYFILNEATGKISTYDTKELFEQALFAQELEPLVWTRWYYDHYTVFHFIFILCIFSWPIAVGVFLFLALLIFLSIALKHRILKIFFIVITSLLFLPLILFAISDFITTSI